MARKHPITAFGWEIKKRLAELRLDQREFCRLHNIPENRLGEIITGTRPAKKYRRKIEKLLGIEPFPANEKQTSRPNSYKQMHL